MCEAVNGFRPVLQSQCQVLHVAVAPAGTPPWHAIASSVGKRYVYKFSASRRPQDPLKRLYRARLEGVSIHTVPEIRYAYKRERDTTGARAVRSILGFAWRTEPIDNDLANADDTHPNEPAPTEEANEPKTSARARSEEEPVHEAMRDFAA